MTTSLSVEDTLGDIVARRPDAARVLDRFRLDYCCAGKRSLAEACAAKGLDPADVLDHVGETTVAADDGWASLDPAALADHIIEVHHVYLHEELPLLEELAAKVDSVHSGRHPELRDVHRLVTELRADLEPHLEDEERIIFPSIREALASEAPTAGPDVAAVAALESDHDRAGELLEELRRTANDFTIPDDACNSYLSLYERLEALEADLHVHVHKENHVLFPAARRAAGGGTGTTSPGGNER